MVSRGDAPGFRVTPRHSARYVSVPQCRFGFIGPAAHVFPFLSESVFMAFTSSAPFARAAYPDYL